MAGYHNIVIPGQFAVGSSFEIGYGTRITELESGAEERLARLNPWGRRRYTLLRGIADIDLIRELQQFYILRGGALNSFKFKDPFEYATTATGTTHRASDDPIAYDDEDLVFITGRSYQLVRRYSDSVRTVVRPLTKIEPDTDLMGANGSQTVDYTIDYETGIVTFGVGVGSIESATGGCAFYVPVRFSESTDEAFAIAMQSTSEAASLPGFDMIEDIAPSTVSQDYQYGGSQRDGLSGVTADVYLTEASGRVKRIETSTQGIRAILPDVVDMPLGGPIFVVQNSPDSTESISIVTSDLTTLVTLNVSRASSIYLGISTGGIKTWISTQTLI
jgi:uncharacterized protein (TIGR02217 family)